MISMKDWSSIVANNINLSELDTVYELTFTCSSKKDEREDWVNNYIKLVSISVIGVNYDPIEVTLDIESESFALSEILNFKLPEGRILVDATSLALPELIYLFMIFRTNKKEFDVIYAQPNHYSGSRKEGVDSIKTFELSDDGFGIQQLPPFVGLTENSTMMIFLGFEGHRVGALLQTEELNTFDATCLLGIPAYKLGWEKLTLANNYKQLEILRSNKNASFEFAGANDPLKVYELIEQNYDAQQYENKRLCLAPLGTKPATLAVAQFAANYEKTIILYDFVQKKERRSLGTDLVHFWSFECS